MTWEVKELDDICSVEYGTRVVQKRDGGTIYPVYGGGDATFFMDTSNRKDCLIISRFAMSEKCTRFVKGEFFLNDSGLSVIPKDKKEIIQEFLNYQILYLNDYIYSLARGTAQKNLDVPAFRKIKIHYPKSLAEQKQIVTLLDSVFEKIAKVKENAEINLKNSKEIFESYLNDIFENKGEGWEEKPFEKCINKIKYPKKILKNEFLISGKYPIISQESKNINGYWNESENLFKIKKPIIIFGDHTKVIKFIDFDFILGADGVKIIEPNNYFFSKYFFYFFKSIKLKNLGYARHYRLLKEILVPVPSLSEQKEIIQKLDQLSEQTKKLEEIYNKKLKSLEELKNSILEKAFKGELTKDIYE